MFFGCNDDVPRFDVGRVRRLLTTQSTPATILSHWGHGPATRGVVHVSSIDNLLAALQAARRALEQAAAGRAGRAHSRCGASEGCHWRSPDR